MDTGEVIALRSGVLLYLLRSSLRNKGYGATGMLKPARRISF
jgi:hypothetical protein